MMCPRLEYESFPLSVKNRQMSLHGKKKVSHSFLIQTNSLPLWSFVIRVQYVKGTVVDSCPSLGWIQNEFKFDTKRKELFMSTHTEMSHFRCDHLGFDSRRLCLLSQKCCHYVEPKQLEWGKGWSRGDGKLTFPSDCNVHLTNKKHKI